MLQLWILGGVVTGCMLAAILLLGALFNIIKPIRDEDC